MAGRRDIEAGSAFVRLYVKNRELQRGLVDVKRRLTKFGRNLTSIGKSIATAGAAIAGPILAAAKSFASFGDQLDKMSARTGVSVQALSELKFAAEQSGASIDAVGEVIQKMNRRVGRITAGEGTTTQTAAIEELGLSVERLAGMNAEERFLAIAEAMNQYGDDAAAAGLAQRAFGTGVDKLLPLIFAGKDGIEALRQEARAAGLTMSKEDAKAAAALTDALTKLKLALGRVWMEIGASVAPKLTELSEGLVGTAKAAMDWVREHRSLVVTALKVGAALAAIGVAVAALGGPFIAVGSAISGMITTLNALNAAMAFLVANPAVVAIAALAAAATALGFAIQGATKDTAQLSNEMQNLAKENDRLRAKDRERLDRLEQLNDAGKLSARQQKQAQSIIAKLTERYGDLGLSINKTTGELEGFAGAQRKVNAAQREAIKTDIEAQIMEVRRNLDELGSEMEKPGLLKKMGMALGEAQADWAPIDFESATEYYDRMQAKSDALLKKLEALRAKEKALAAGETVGAGIDEGKQPAGAAPAAPGGAAGEDDSWLAFEAAPKTLDDVERRINRIAELDKRNAHDVARLKIRLEKEGLDERLALLDLERQQELEAAKEQGLDLEAIRKKFELRERIARQQAGTDQVAASYRAPSALIKGTQAEYNARIQSQQEKMLALAEEAAARDEERNELLDDANDQKPKLVGAPP